MISCLPFDKKKRIGQYWIWLSAFFSILQFPHFLSSFLENKEDDLGPVHVLIYRSSYGSTDCDALCQVSKHKLICNEQNYQINQPQNVAQSTKSFKKEIHNYLLKLAFDEKVCGYYGNLKVARFKIIKLQIFGPNWLKDLKKWLHFYSRKYLIENYKIAAAFHHLRLLTSPSKDITKMLQLNQRRYKNFFRNQNILSKKMILTTKSRFKKWIFFFSNTTS